jgi:VWFA-related protein
MPKRVQQTSPLLRAFLFAALTCALAAAMLPRASLARKLAPQDARAGEGESFVSVELPATGEVRIENQRGGVALEVWGEKYLAIATVSGDATLPADADSPALLERTDNLLTIIVPRKTNTRAATNTRPAAPTRRTTSSRAASSRAAASRAATPSRAARAPRGANATDPPAINLIVRVPEQARVTVVTSGGTVEAHGTPARLEVQTVGGDVRLSLTPNADADIMARTLYGMITVGAGVGADAVGRTLRERFSARLGAGARLVRLSSVRGSIDLETGAQMAVAAPEHDDRTGEARSRASSSRAPSPESNARAGASNVRAPELVAGVQEANQRRRPPVLVGANDAAAQRPSQQPTPPPGTPVEVGEDDVLTVDTSVVTLNFSVVDRKSGRGLANLTGADFKVFENNAEQQITHFETTNAPFDLLLLVDLSGSTAHVTDLIRASARRFVDSVRANDRVGVVAFAAAPQVISPLTSDKQTLHARIDAMGAPQGDTKLYDAINYSLDYLAANSPKARRRAVVLLTDGMDSALPNVQGDGSALPYQELRRRVQEFDGLFYAVMTDNYEEPQSPLDVQPETYDLAWDRMEELANTAGGLYYEAEKLEDVSDIYARVVEDLGTVYSISYLPTNKARDGRWRAIRVRLPRRPEAITRGRSGYYAK